jgi:hypothetical protein
MTIAVPERLILVTKVTL